MAKKRKLPLIITGIVLAVLVVAAIAGFFTARWYFQDKAAPGVTFGLEPVWPDRPPTS